MKIAIINGVLEKEKSGYCLYKVGSYSVIERLFRLCKNHADKVYFLVNDDSYFDYEDVIKKYNINVIFVGDNKSIEESVNGFYTDQDILYFVDCNVFLDEKVLEDFYFESIDLFDAREECVVSVRIGKNVRLNDNVKKEFIDGSVTIDTPNKYSDLVKSFYVKNALNFIDKGVNVIDVYNTYIDDEVVIEEGVVVYPNSHVSGKSKIGKGTTIYSNCCIEDSFIGENCFIGPFSNLKKGTDVGFKCIVGAFVELKNTVLRNNVKVKHHAYLGDGLVGDNCNVGCGTIFANYDGKEKHKTVIGDNCFIGSNVTIVAPCSIGEGSVIAAGSTIVENVKDYSLAIARARQVNKIDYYK